MRLEHDSSLDFSRVLPFSLEFGLEKFEGDRRWKTLDFSRSIISIEFYLLK